jgi:DNA-binding GntR family transcriptional regulator
MLTIFVHAVSPCAIPVQAAVRSLSGMVALPNIVYNTVSNIIIIIENSCRRVMRRPHRRGGGASSKSGPLMVGKPAKHAIARTPKSRQMTISPARAPAAAIIAKSIEEDIVLGRRHPRERLVEQDLCDLFQTHRGDVRLALFELEKKGLVERIPNRGALVRGLTPLEVTEIYAVREELEVMAVRIIPFPVSSNEIERLEELQRQHSAAVAAGDLLTVFYSNLSFHQVLFGLCGNACLIETIDLLAQKVYGIRSYANAFPESLDRARQDHLDMIKALRRSRRDDLIVLTRRHLEPSPQAYIKAYERRFGKADLAPAH